MGEFPLNTLMIDKTCLGVVSVETSRLANASSKASWWFLEAISKLQIEIIAWVFSNCVSTLSSLVVFLIGVDTAFCTLND